jgi:DNA-binding IclR family transcriptional regulator
VKPQKATPGQGASGRVQSVDRAVELLRAVAGSAPAGETVAALAARCAINRATAWRLLATLEHHGMVERDQASNRYRIGFTVERLAASAGVEGLINRAHPVVERLAAETGETVNLAVPRNGELTYVDEVVPSTVLSARWLGQPAPFHATSTGKALLAWLPDDERAALLPARLHRYTGTTLTTLPALRGELKAVRDQGYAVSVGEMEPSLFGVSSAVRDARDHPMAVLSIWGPRDRVPEDRFPALGALAAAGAAEIARAVRRT